LEHQVTRRTDGLWVSPSQALECPRLRILKPVVPYYVRIDYTWAALLGSALHAAVLRGETTELFLEGEVRVDGIPVPVKGTCDYYDAETGTVYDIKLTSRFRDLPKLEHVFQVNVYRWLLETNGYPVSALKIWYVTPYRDGAVKRELVTVERFPREEVEAWLAEVARPLVVFQDRGELPACRCQYRGSLEPHPCQVEGAEHEAWRYYTSSRD